MAKRAVIWTETALINLTSPSRLLLPFAALYDGITRLRNHLYDIQPKKTVHFTPFVLSVGNLSVGGTGKTPMVTYLAHWLAQDYPLAILSRGYGRQTRGVRIAGEHDTAIGKRICGNGEFKTVEKRRAMEY